MSDTELHPLAVGECETLADSLTLSVTLPEDVMVGDCDGVPDAQ